MQDLRNERLMVSGEMEFQLSEIHWQILLRPGLQMWPACVLVFTKHPAFYKNILFSFIGLKSLYKSMDEQEMILFNNQEILIGSIRLKRVSLHSTMSLTSM